jgi:hypothetical protein
LDFDSYKSYIRINDKIKRVIIDRGHAWHD